MLGKESCRLEMTLEIYISLWEKPELKKFSNPKYWYDDIKTIKKLGFDCHKGDDKSIYFASEEEKTKFLMSL